MGVETAISPVFGLTLIELVENTIIGAISGAIVGMSAAVIVAVSSHRDSKKQFELQQKMVSAQLSQKMLEYWEPEKHKWFYDFVKLIPTTKITKDHPYIDRYLGIWEEIAMYCNEGTIMENHRNELFGPDLKYIRDNKVVCGHLKEKHTETTYNNLWKLMEETCGTCGDG